MSPASISCSSTPRLHTVSPSALYSPSLTHSGGEYTRVPRNSVYTRTSSSSPGVTLACGRKQPDPKSMSLVAPVLRSTRMFSSLMSLWRTPASRQPTTVSTILRNIRLASDSDSLPFSVMKSKRSWRFFSFSMTM